MHAATDLQSCHRMIDPIGLRSRTSTSPGGRIKEGRAVTGSDFYDGTPMRPSDCARRCEAADPWCALHREPHGVSLGADWIMTCRRAPITRMEPKRTRVSAFIVGVATSDAFLMKAAPVIVDEEPANGNGG